MKQPYFRLPTICRAIPILLAVALLLLPGATSTIAGRNYRNFRPKKSPPPVPPLVQAVDAAANTITVKDGSDVTTYKVDKLTTISVNGSPGKLSDITKGMAVTVAAATQGRASKIEAENAPEAKGKKK